MTDSELRYARYAQLRELSPYHWEPDRRQCLLTRFDDVYGVLRNHDDFSSARKINTSTERCGVNGSAVILMTDDPPRHTRIRSLVNRWFTTSALERFRPWIITAVRSLVEDIQPGRVDIVRRLTEPLPVMTIAHLLGLDAQQWRLFKRWSASAVGANASRETDDRLRDLLEAYRYFARQVQARKASPLADLISYVLRQAGDEEGLTDVEAQAYCLLLLVAGNETTNGLMGNLFSVLSRDAALWIRLREGQVPLAAVVDETLRYDCPVQILRRIAKRDTVLNGQYFRQGDVIEACLGAANRDPQEFSDPDTFRPTRDFRRHLAFGHGIHYCLGAPLARMIASTALSEVLGRFKNFVGLGEGQRTSSYSLSGFACLLVELHE